MIRTIPWLMMHAPPPAAKLQFLLGMEIAQVILDPWATRLHFANGGHIAIECPFEHIDAKGNIHLHQGSDEQDRGPVWLRDLLSHRIFKVTVEDANLLLIFDDGARLHVLAEVCPYESAQIYPDGQSPPIVF
jgi:hypothetical protein